MEKFLKLKFKLCAIRAGRKKMNLDLFDNNQGERVLPFKLPIADGYSFRWDDELDGFVINIPNGELFYSERFFEKSVCDRSVEYFLENESNDWKTIDWHTLNKESLSCVKFVNINWRHDKLNMYGKEHYLPRYSAWYGDSGKSYTYSGIHLEPNAWNKGLLYIKEAIEKVSDVNFNSVLLNWYRDGDDYISWHTDAEKELSENPTIASINFGATRRFLIRRIDDHSIKLELPLKHGSLLIMKGELQHYWQHSVPKQKKVKDARFNLTFRTISVSND